MTRLHNKYNRQALIRKLHEEPFARTTCSFYRYVRLEAPGALRDSLYQAWNRLQVFGRVYLAREGINAQVSVPDHHMDDFRRSLDSYAPFRHIHLNIAVDDDGHSFYKLTIKVRPNIVADGLYEGDYDVTRTGQRLSPEEFHRALESPDTVVVDMRNHYESEVGHFKGALRPQVTTFREELPVVLRKLQDKKDKQVLLYCTGGIRCEKASAFLRHHGFRKVNQLQGGIINYARTIREKGWPSHFIGKNFVFDERLGERVSHEVISRCHQCGKPCDAHTNCHNDLCHLLFIQCADCARKYEGCCTPRCQEAYHMPDPAKAQLRNRFVHNAPRNVYNPNRHPTLPEQIRAQEKARQCKGSMYRKKSV